MKNTFKIIILTLMSILPFSCSNNADINQVIQQQMNVINNWHSADNIPAFLISNKYMNTYYSELYEHGGLVNAALIDQIQNKELLLKIISSCDVRLDKKPSLKIFENINFGKNRLFDLYYNYTIREIATLRYRISYGSKDLASQMNRINPNCKNLDSFTTAMINGIKFSGNEQGSIGFVIKFKRLKMNKDILVDQKNLEKQSLIILKDKQNPKFRELDSVSAEMIKSVIKLNPNDTFQIDYIGPYISYKKEKEGFNISHKENEVSLSLQCNKLY